MRNQYFAYHLVDETYALYNVTFYGKDLKSPLFYLFIPTKMRNFAL